MKFACVSLVSSCTWSIMKPVTHNIPPSCFCQRMLHTPSIVVFIAGFFRSWSWLAVWMVQLGSMSNLKISYKLKNHYFGVWRSRGVLYPAPHTCGVLPLHGVSKHPLHLPQNTSAILGRRASVCATTSHAMSTAYTAGQCLVDSSRSTWSRVLSFLIMNFVADITYNYVQKCM